MREPIMWIRIEKGFPSDNAILTNRHNRILPVLLLLHPSWQDREGYISVPWCHHGVYNERCRPQAGSGWDPQDLGQAQFVTETRQRKILKLQSQITGSDHPSQSDTGVLNQGESSCQITAIGTPTKYNTLSNLWRLTNDSSITSCQPPDHRKPLQKQAPWLCGTRGATKYLSHWRQPSCWKKSWILRI